VGPYVKDVVVLVMMMVIVGFQRGDMKQRLSHGDRVHVMRCYMFMFMFMVIVCMDPSSMEVVFGWWVPLSLYHENYTWFV
jgi:hypothetical protein